MTDDRAVIDPLAVCGLVRLLPFNVPSYDDTNNDGDVENSARFLGYRSPLFLL
jgi:hypothetical protein